MMLITLEQASEHLRRDTDDDDADLTLKIEAASEAVMEYLKWTEVPADIPYRAKAATLALVGEMYRNREGEMGGAVNSQFGYGYLPHGVVALLYPLRNPSLA